jgi:hypothetical protein
MDHDPELAVLIVLEFREVIAAAQRAELPDPFVYCLMRRLPAVVHREKVTFGVATLVALRGCAEADVLLKLLVRDRDIAALSDTKADTVHDLLGELAAQPVIQSLCIGIPQPIS